MDITMPEIQNPDDETAAEKLDELLEELKRPDFKLADYDPQHEKKNRLQSWVQPYKK